MQNEVVSVNMRCVSILRVTRCGCPLQSYRRVKLASQSQPTPLQIPRVNVPNRSIQLNLLLSSQLNSTQLNSAQTPHTPSAKRLPKSPNTSPRPPKRTTAPVPRRGTLHPNYQFSAFGSSVCPAFPLTSWLHLVSASLTTSIRFLPRSRM